MHAKILIVDDEEGVRRLIKKALSLQGYECLLASNAAEARGLLMRQKIDLIVSDIRMPGESGLDLIQYALATYPDMAVIVVSGIGDPETAKAALTIGVHGYLVKPFEHAQVLISAMNALRSKELESNERTYREGLEELVAKKTVELRDRVARLEEAQRALKESEESSGAITESAQDAIFRIDNQGRISYWNGAAERIFGWKREEAVGREFYRLIAPERQRSAHAKAFERFRESGEGLAVGKTMEKVAIRKGGDEFPVELSISAVKIKGLWNSIAILRDISERKQLEGQLSRRTQDLEEAKAGLASEHEKLNRLFARVERAKVEWERTMDCIQSMLLLTDETGKIVRVNRAVSEFTGKTYRELIGQEWDKMLFGECPGVEPNPDSVPEIRHEPSGKWLSVKTGPLYKEDASSPYGKVISIYDSTSLKETTLALEAKSESLQAAYRELKDTQALIIQQEKLASIGQLAAGVAHEINNPTGFISSNLKTLSDYLRDLFRLMEAYREVIRWLKAKEPLTGPLSDLVQRIESIETEADIGFIMEDTPTLLEESQEGTERIKKIVQDLKDFAHPGKQELVYADINKNLDSTLNIAWNEIKYKAKVRKDYGELPEVRCFPQQLNQVFMNILVNAAQAIDRDGEITITTQGRNSHVEIRISDTGKGIPEGLLPRIFEPFFTTKEVGKGTGLGLNVAYNIIKKHKGSIEVESSLGKGTTFVVQIPVHGPG